LERYRVQEWLNFITSEIHKSFGPLFRDTTPAEYKATLKENLTKRYAYVDEHLAKHQFLFGEKFTVADAYLYTVSRWLPRVGMEIGQWPNVKAYVDRIAARPKVQEALQAEGLK
jgi:glutathione S-transferase